MKEEVNSVLIGLLDCGGLWTVESGGLTVRNVLVIIIATIVVD